MSEMPGNDSDDHAHMAAAVVRQPCTNLINNKKDFPIEPLAELGVRITDPDTYLCELTEEFPDEMVHTIVRLASEKTRPPKTSEDLLEDLRRTGVPLFVASLRPRLRPC